LINKVSINGRSVTGFTIDFAELMRSGNILSVLTLDNGLKVKGSFNILGGSSKNPSFTFIYRMLDSDKPVGANRVYANIALENGVGLSWMWMIRAWQNRGC